MDAQQAKVFANLKSKVHALDKDIQTIKALATEVGEKHAESVATKESVTKTETVETKIVEDIKPQKINGEGVQTDKPVKNNDKES